MKPASTLIDTLYRATFAKDRLPRGWKSPVEMRHAFESARRFVVADERTSAFMAELTNESFVKAGYGSPLSVRIADSLRTQARLPHESVWIEYNIRAYQRRSVEIIPQRHGIPFDPKAVPAREGWLIQQHPQINTAYIIHLFTQDEINPDEHGYTVWTFPFAYAWRTDDNPLPWRTNVEMRTDGGNWASEFIVGVPGYCRDDVAIVKSPLIDDPWERGFDRNALQYLMHEWNGIARRVWALLATIDHLPITRGDVRQSKGFLARGRIRKFLDHQTITLNIPAKKDTRVLARQMIAIAHRKRHEVRAHWRNDWRNPPSSRCNPHLWQPIDNDADLIRCDICGGRQIFIHKHERGDASLGYTTHSYVVKHETDNGRSTDI